MILSVDPGRALPVYEQVREQIRRMVAAGTLSAGAQLPTIRQLATDLGLAKGTIARAYELLESDGVIASRGRKGSVVLEMVTASREQQTAGLDTAAEQLVVTARQLGATQSQVVEALRRVWDRL